MSTATPAAERWRDALSGWGIPERILARAPESPWGYSVELFASRADAAVDRPTDSNRWAREALPPGGVVLDVGCGAGAASLPLATQAGRVVGVDPSPGMLAAFRERAAAAGIESEGIEGSWPEAADRAPSADVVVCHHVVYNVPDLRAFALRLTDHARSRVVLEMTTTHPLSAMSPLWLRFHDLVRPTVPTVDDALDVLREAGLSPDHTVWTAPRPGGFAAKADLVASIRRQLCLPADRDPDVEEALGDRIVERDGRWGLPDRPVATVWWPSASA
jgi:SAM-dependent methyltransferase